MNGQVKEFRTYDQQVDLLVRRGMDVGAHEDAVGLLRRVNYYRLSGYWYPFRKPAAKGDCQDEFLPGTKLSDVAALYEFDIRLRTVAFSELARIELAVRALLGHELGRVDPCAHLDPAKLGPTARGGSKYSNWLAKYEEELARSREDFVEHHRQRYGGRLPVWVAVEVLDWGGLAYLFGFAPRHVQDIVAGTCGLTGPQMTTWLTTLNLLRNVCAHHGRLFNRVHTNVPRLPTIGLHRDLDEATTEWSRTFGQLTLIQFLLDRLQLGKKTMLPAVLKTFPQVKGLPIQHVGATADWQSRSSLWST